MTPLSVVRGFDYAIIGVSGVEKVLLSRCHTYGSTRRNLSNNTEFLLTGLIFLYCCIAALTVVPWRKSKRESYAIKSFNSYWHARALLLLTGGLWVVSLFAPASHLLLDASL